MVNYKLIQTLKLSFIVCGGILSTKHGEIASPSMYKNNMECIWEIQASMGYHIGLAFKGRFFIEDSPNCTNDYLQVIFFTNSVLVIKCMV